MPVIADADTGYGSELNATRTVREYERRGVAGLHIEDQGFPKKCGHLDNKVIVPLEEYLAKCEPRSPRGRTPISSSSRAPTCARVLGLRGGDRARANAALARRCRHGLRRGAADAGGGHGGTASGRRPMPAQRACWRGKTPDIAFADAQRAGYKLAIVPGLLFKAVIGVCDAMLAELKACGQPSRSRHAA